MSDDRVSKCISKKVEEGWDQDRAVAACQDMERRGQLADDGSYRGDGTDSHLRLDVQDVPSVQKTDEGYLWGEARIARIGVQEYSDGNGGIRRELRHPEDVFAADALASLRMLPITDGHPPERVVDASNAAKRTVGHVGENVRVDGRWVVAPIVITDQDMVERIERGERQQLSVGYQVRAIDEEGEWEGTRYDARQTMIRGNHLSIVGRARAGDGARLNLDAADAVAVHEPATATTRSDGMGDKTTLKVDGIDYEVPPQVERHVAKLDEERANLQKERDQLQAKHDELQEQLNQRSDEKVRELAQRRARLERTAAEVIGDGDYSGHSDRQLQERVVKQVHPNVQLDGQSDDYVAARFDAAIEAHQHSRQDVARQRQAAVGDGVTPRADAGVDSVTKARTDALTEIRQRYRGGASKQQ